MKAPTFLALGKLKTGVVAVTVMGLLFAVGGTQSGQRIFALLGVDAAWAGATDAVEQLAQNGGNAVQAFLARSPGQRGTIDTLKGRTKGDVEEDTKVPSGSNPTQRSLGKIFDDPLQSLAGPLVPATAPAVEFLPVDANSAPEFRPAALPIPAGAGVFAPVVGGLPSGGGSIGGIGSGGTGDIIAPPAPPVAVAAVPEPSTWMLLLMGFAAVGASLRRRKAVKVCTSDRAGKCATVS